jgi:hypothetical protein
VRLRRWAAGGLASVDGPVREGQCPRKEKSVGQNEASAGTNGKRIFFFYNRELQGKKLNISKK